MKRRAAVAVLLLAVAAAGVWLWRAVRRDREGLVLSGSLEARTVEVGSLVGGRVLEVYV